MTPEVLTGAEVSQILQVSRNHVYELVRSGKIRTLRLDSAIRVPRTALDAFIRQVPEPVGPASWQACNRGDHQGANEPAHRCLVMALLRAPWILQRWRSGGRAHWRSVPMTAGMAFPMQGEGALAPSR